MHWIDPLGGWLGHWLGVVAIGAAVGFLGGMFGKGGSAVATPLLAAIGVPPLVAVASPLPATIPSTLAAYRHYHRAGISDPEVVRWSIGLGVPATIAGAIATRWISGGGLIVATEVVVAVIGAGILLGRERPEVVRPVGHRRLRTAGVAVTVGVLAGLLANSGGFLLAPLYLTVLRLRIKTALAVSLAVAAVLAVPGTVVHAALGHIDWALTATLAAASTPLSNLGARTALRLDPTRLERAYGATLLALGVALLAAR